MAKLESVKSMHERLRAAFRSQWDSIGESDRLATSELQEMVKSFGEVRTKVAVDTFIRSEQFFSVAKLREYVPQGNAAPLYDPNCPHCDQGLEELRFEKMNRNDKHKLIRVYGLAEARNHTVTVRCSVCWKGTREQKASV